MSRTTRALRHVLLQACRGFVTIAFLRNHLNECTTNDRRLVAVVVVSKVSTRFQKGLPCGKSRQFLMSYSSFWALEVTSLKPSYAGHQKCLPSLGATRNLPLGRARWVAFLLLEVTRSVFFLPGPPSEWTGKGREWFRLQNLTQCRGSGAGKKEGKMGTSVISIIT